MNIDLFFDIFELIMCFYTFIFILYYFIKARRLKYEKIKNSEILIVVSSFELKKFVVENVKKLRKVFDHVVVLTVKDHGISIKGVDIVKASKDFSCKAIRKGRDLLYFARNYKIPEKVKYILFLDEDSFPQTPIEIPLGADVVILTEYIEKHKNPLIVSAELQRRGFGIEEWLFLNFLNLPLYLWGGGLLIRKEFVKYLPDYPTIIEDSVYGWNIYKEFHKKQKKKIRFARSKTKISSCPPNDLKTMFKQRARWFMGTVFDIDQAPIEIRWITKIRLFYWVTSLPFYMFTDPFTKLIAIVSFTIQAMIACREQNYPWYYVATWLAGAILNTMMAWTAPFLQRDKDFKVTKKACDPEA